MKNKRLQLLQSFIGKPFSGSPSPFAKWLNGTVIAVDENSVEFQFEYNSIVISSTPQKSL